jgi:hypothetical protein
VEAFIETALSGQDMSSTFRHGGMSWGLKAALAAFAVPCVEVTAAKWKRAAGIALGFDKEHLRQMALRRWPDQAKHRVASVTAAGPRQCRAGTNLMLSKIVKKLARHAATERIPADQFFCTRQWLPTALRFEHNSAA